MMRGVLCSLFVAAVFSGTALAEESPVQVVDRPAAVETPSAKPARVAKAKTHHKTPKHKTTKHKARKHAKKSRHHNTPAPTPE